MPLPNATFTIDRPEPGVVVVAIVGDLDVYSAPDLRSAHIDLINEGRYRQVLDLTAVNYADSSGLGVIVGALKRARSRGGNLALVVDLDGDVGRVLRTTGVYKTIAHAPTVGEALEMLAPKTESDSGFDEARWQQDCRAALERAIGWHRMQSVDWDEVESDASALHLAEDDAIGALNDLAQSAADLAAEITNPDEPQDERRPFRYASLSGEFEAATIAMAHLASERNRVRPSR